MMNSVTAKRFDIRDFGAEISDRLQTNAIQAAIDAAAVSGGAVVFPEGCWRTGGLILKSGVTLILKSGAEIEASRDERDYPGERRWYRGIIRADNAHDIGIIGEPFSRINGMNCFDARGEEDFRGPHGILFSNCTDVVLSGYTVKDSGNWAHALFHCSRVKTDSLKVYGGHDAFDFHDSEDVEISNCEFHTGDDCIAGYANRNCRVHDCIFDTSCQAIRIGGADLVFERCRMTDHSAFGHRYALSPEEKERSVTNGDKSKHGAVAAVIYYCDNRWKIDRPQKNLVFRDCDFQSCGRAFSYNYDGRDMWSCCHPLESALFEGCRFSGIKNTDSIYSDAERPIELTFRKCTFAAAEGCGDKALMTAYQFGKIAYEDCAFEGFSRPHIITRSKGEVNINRCGALENDFRPDPNDIIYTFDEAARLLEKMASDEAAWKEWADSIPAPDENLWDADKGTYVCPDAPLVKDMPTTVLAVMRGQTAHTSEIGNCCLSLFRYLTGWLLTGRVLMPDGTMSVMPAGPFAYAIYKTNPLFARAFITDFLRRDDTTPAAVAGMKLALRAIISSAAPCVQDSRHC